MQHDCYPFVLYNMMVFWMYLSRMSYEVFCGKVRNLMADKIDRLTPLMDDYCEGGRGGRFLELLEGEYEVS